MNSMTCSETEADVSQDDAVLVLRQFRQVLNSVKTHFQQVEKLAGLGGAQVWALSVIQRQPGLGLKDLAGAMDIHQSTASNLVRTLAERLMIQIRKEGQDRRAVQLHLLPAGGEALERAPGPFEGVLPGALRAMDKAALRRLRMDLARLMLVLDADERAAKIPLAEM